MIREHIADALVLRPRDCVPPLVQRLKKEEREKERKDSERKEREREREREIERGTKRKSNKEGEKGDLAVKKRRDEKEVLSPSSTFFPIHSLSFTHIKHL